MAAKAWSTKRAAKWGAGAGVLYQLLRPIFVPNEPLPNDLGLVLAQCIGGAVGGIFLFALVAAVRNKMLGATDMKPSPAGIMVEPGSVAEPIPLTREEEEIKKAAEAFKRNDDERNATYRIQQAALADAKALAEKGDKFAKQSHLDHAIPYLFEEMKHWPAWSKRGDGDKWVPPLGMEDLDGKIVGVNPGWLEWRTAGFLYRIEFEESRMPPDPGSTNEYGDFTLKVDGEDAFGCMAARDCSKEWDRWRYSVLTALKVGPWLTPLIEFYGQVRFHDEQKRADRDTKYHLDRASRIDLGQDPA